MKKLFISLALISGYTATAQQENGDTTRFKFGSTEFIIINGDTSMVDGEDPDDNFEIKYQKEDLTYWGGLDVGVNILMNENFQNSFSEKHLECDPAQSFSYSFNFGEKRINIIKDYFGIVTGLGFTNSRFGFDDNRVRLGSNSDSTFGWVDSTLSSGGFNKNQLRVNYFKIPLLFHVNTSKNPDNNFHFSFGAIGGVRIGSNVRYKYDVLGGERKDKEKGRYNINAFSLEGTFRMGYKDFGLFANYNLIPVFENGKSTAAYPLTVGASFNF